MNGAREGARTFVALALGRELGERVAAEAARVLDARDFRRPAGAGLHLTLEFLGDVERERLGELSRALAGSLAGLAAPALRLGGTGAFPSLARPRVLWVGVEERASPGRLATCRAAVLAGLARAGFGAAAAAQGAQEGSGEGEHAAFTPHVTVARPRGARARVPEEFAALRLELDWSPAAVELFESERGPAGSRYVVLQRWPLAGLE